MVCSKLLLIDDDLDDHEIFSIAIEQAERPMEIVRAYDGAEALSYLTDNDDALPDAIFVDLNMPRMNGKTFLKNLKSHPRFAEIPVVVYSTSSDIRDLIETQDLGASAFIVKSTSVHELAQTLRSFFHEV